MKIDLFVKLNAELLCFNLQLCSCRICFALSMTAPLMRQKPNDLRDMGFPNSKFHVQLLAEMMDTGETETNLSRTFCSAEAGFLLMKQHAVFSL